MKKSHDNDEQLLNSIAQRTEFIPVISKEDEDVLLQDGDVPSTLPLLPLREMVLFPGVLMPIVASRKSSAKLLKEAAASNRKIGVVAQRNDREETRASDFHKVGVMARVIKTFDLPDDNTMCVVQGSVRFRLHSVTGPIGEQDGYFEGTVTPYPETIGCRKQVFANGMSRLRSRYGYILKNRAANGMPMLDINEIGSDKILINFIATHLDASGSEKQELLECPSYYMRMNMVSDLVENEAVFQEVRSEVQDKTRNELSRQQREYFLNQQMRIIQDELGGDHSDGDIEELHLRASKIKWPESVAETFDRELSRLKRLQPQTPEYSVQYNYLDFMLSLPWDKSTTDDLRIDHARKVLDKEHFGIEKVKDRIIEHLAVLSLKGDMKAPIICLVGPPGTGKTSLGKSIATAMNRKYVRVALGGLHDEAEIRGHRRTYIGAMPGRILQSIKRAGSSNPVFILDEIDKVQGQSVNGDPTSALLEVLDPEQNKSFHDNYLDIDYDLSHVMFIATANTLSTIQPALLDRMEVIDLSGYLLEEKVEIASRHIVPRELKEHGFAASDVKFPPKIIELIINSYTRESGVRGLDKAVAKVVRHRAVKVASGEPIGKGRAKNITADEVREALGLPLPDSNYRAKEPAVGVVTGLAWTPVGGEILFIESSLSQGKATLSMTGNLGDVMKESATLAFEYLKSNASRFGIDNDLIERSNIHIHVPEGATPKDGPSAGITMFVAMVSAFSGRKVRPEVAMTGEITLRGVVTPVGGIKEKILAAKRAGITDIIMSEQNRRDIEDIKPEYLSGLQFHYINNMSEALALALAE
ncbi:MAG: endopeptidase La [Bacteroidales bacterium]|nr:endopeptidase La [Bacteroidales bacterium]